MDCLLLWFYFMVLRFAVAAEHMNQFVFDDNLLLPQPTAWNYIFGKHEACWGIAHLKFNIRISWKFCSSLYCHPLFFGFIMIHYTYRILTFPFQE